MEHFLPAILNINLLVSAYMTGIIWLIQVLHYPLFLQIQAADFSNFHLKHTKVMGFLVGPVMCIELIVGLSLIILQFNYLTLLNFIFVSAIWGCTFFVSVPLHSQLTRNWDPDLIDRLIRTNWPRTALWTLKLILAFYLCR